MSSILKTITSRIENHIAQTVYSIVDVKDFVSDDQKNICKINDIVNPILHGPWLYTQGQDLETDVWKVSMSLVIQTNTENPHVKCDGVTIPGEVFFRKYDLTFMRYAFPIKMLPAEQQISYFINNQQYCFFVPGISQQSRGMYFSCNGTQSKNDYLDEGRVEKMWCAFNSLPESGENECHYMACGGDFLYIDGFEEYKEDSKLLVKALGVFELPSIQKWLSLNPEERDIFPFTKDMEEEVFRYYFEEYLKHMQHPELKKALSKNPYMGIWDDHDIFDGFGSYPDQLNNSPVFRGLYQIALTMYLLFQQQTTAKNAYQEGFFGPQGYHFLRYFDNGQLAILGVDNRAGRTRERILHEETWNEIFRRLLNLPKSCKHLVVMLGVPVVYSSITKFVQIMENPISEEIFTKFKALRNQFGLIELEDDGIDHWDCKEHEEERRFVIQQFQKLGVRVTFLSGDVHLGGLGIILPKTETQIDHSDDLKAISSIPTAIVQIISSAIENEPPSKKVASLLGNFGKIELEVDEKTISKMLQISQRNKKFKKDVLIPKRNFGILKIKGEDLSVTIYKETKQAVNSKFFVWNIPPVTKSIEKHLPKAKLIKT